MTNLSYLINTGCSGARRSLNLVDVVFATSDIVVFLPDPLPAARHVAERPVGLTECLRQQLVVLLLDAFAFGVVDESEADFANWPPQPLAAVISESEAQAQVNWRRLAGPSHGLVEDSPGGRWGLRR